MTSDLTSNPRRFSAVTYGLASFWIKGNVPFYPFFLICPSAQMSLVFSLPRERGTVYNEFFFFFLAASVVVELKAHGTDLHLKENLQKHHTDRYDNECLIVRRGAYFKLSLDLNREYNKDRGDKIQLQLAVGKSLSRHSHAHCTVSAPCTIEPLQNTIILSKHTQRHFAAHP